jgi:hypothetical protein
MIDPFDQLKRSKANLSVRCVSRTFAVGSTYRMLRGTGAETIRCFFREQVGAGERLVSCRGPKDYDKRLREVTARLMRTCRLCFGHASKLANLYFKELATRRGVLSTAAARRLYGNAHVPIDRRILTKLRQDFPKERIIQEIPAGLTLRSLNKHQYAGIQSFLRVRAKQKGLSALDYDLWWGE